MRSSVETVTGTPACDQPGQGSVRVPRADAGLEVARRTEVERHAGRAQLRHEIGIIGRGRTVRDPRGADAERPSDLGRAAPFAGMAGDPEATRSRDRERARERQRIGRLGLAPGEVEAGHASLHGGDAGARDLVRERWRMRPQRHDDEAHDDARPIASLSRGISDRVHDAPDIEAALEVQRRCPADLRVPGAIRGDVLDQVARDARE